MRSLQYTQQPVFRHNLLISSLYGSSLVSVGKGLRNHGLEARRVTFLSAESSNPCEASVRPRSLGSVFKSKVLSTSLHFGMREQPHVCQLPTLSNGWLLLTALINDCRHNAAC